MFSNSHLKSTPVLGCEERVWCPDHVPYSSIKPSVAEAIENYVSTNYFIPLLNVGLEPTDQRRHRAILPSVSTTRSEQDSM
jgi:hypothetical protein